MKTGRRYVWFLLVLCGAGAHASAQDHGVDLVIAQRQFVPQSLTVPANRKVEVRVRNRDKLPAEFESYDLSREVVIPPGGKVSVFVGPLKPGKYSFFDDFNPDARGWIVVESGTAGG